MKSLPIRPSGRAGYTLVEVLAAAGLITAAIGAACALSMNLTRQEELSRGQAAAIRYGEALARLWQLDVDPSSVLLTQTQGSPGSSGNNPLIPEISATTQVDLPSNEGRVDKANVSVTYLPYGGAVQKTITLDVLRPAASHR